MLTVRLLGAEEVRGEDGREVEELLRQPRRFALLAYLAAAEPRQLQSREVLIGLLWPDIDQSRARHDLNQALYFLRHALGHASLVAGCSKKVALNADVVSSDVWTFRRAIQGENFEDAVAVYRGPFLDGFRCGASAAFEQWVDQQRDDLSRALARALEHLADACAAKGMLQEEIGWWRRLTELNPYSTHPRLRLMAALAAAGDRGGAIAQADRHAAKLRDDLGAEPSPDTTAYAEALRRRPPLHGDMAADRFVRLAGIAGRRYLVERELGGGGLAVVYLASDVKHRRKVAIKVLRPELADTLGSELFLQEIRATAALNHPLILPLLDSGKADGFLYYVMPYVEDESLRERLTRESRLSIDDSLTIAREVADALAFAHKQGVLHRDIKPENILLEAGHAVVADFGVAGAVARAGKGGILDYTLVGTSVYQSPEQAVGSPDLDARSDLYSLGCVLYEMLAGRPPYTGSTVESLTQQHRSAAPASVTAIRPSVPAWLAAALERCLAKAPRDRFDSVVQFAEAITP